jgi:hypothetical protein
MIIIAQVVIQDVEAFKELPLLLKNEREKQDKN